jgi:hypothetical protein
MSINWTTISGSLGTIQERTRQEINLVATSTSGTVTYSLQAGSLPAGLRLENGKIKGTAFEVRNTKTSRFVIRAHDNEDKKDRTFSITVEGADAPIWITREGILPVGPNSTFFVLDNDKVDFRLEAIDPDIPAGDELEYYIPWNGGELPPGLSLSSDGRISGFTDPIFAIEYGIFSGNFDEQLFDSAPYDLGTRPINGYDSFTFDEQSFDYFDISNFPRRQSRYYQFVVAISDGLNETRRSFQIFIVNEDYLKADNTIMQVGTGIFRADNTNIRNPIWITESDLGAKRANNYVTLFLEVYDPPTLPGTISYRLETVNPEMNGIIIDRVVDQDEYIDIQITPNAKGEYLIPRRTQKLAIADLFNYIDSTLGTYTITLVENIGTNRYRLYIDPMAAQRFSVGTEVIIGSPSEVPPGLEIDTIVGEMVGKIPYQPRITKEYKFTVTATANNFDNEARASTPRTFSIKILGEIESGIAWVSGADLGSISPNKNSQLVIEAVSKLRGGAVLFGLESGTLPPGLSLLPSGEIIGKVNQFASNSRVGLSRFYNKYITVENVTGTFEEGDIITGSDSSSAIIIKVDSNKIYYKSLPGQSAPTFVAGDQIIDNVVGPEILKTATIVTVDKEYNYTYDAGTTTFDKKYTFVIRAKDIFNYAESSKTFQIEIVSEADSIYANLFVKAFQKKSKRNTWYSFISDSSIFDPDKIYRYGDPAFGVQNEIKMLLYAGIESLEAEKYIQAMSRNHYRKRLRFGKVRSAVAKDPITQTVIYEVVYVDIIDNLQKNGTSISTTVNLPNVINSKVLINNTNITIDSDIPFISDRDHQRIFPNSIKNMRRRLKDITVTEGNSNIRSADRDRTYLPLWMRSIQEASFVETGFVSALPLCYVKPGHANDIILNIKNSGFDFKILDFEVDRYLIDAIDGVLEDKYLAFPQRGEKE